MEAKGLSCFALRPGIRKVLMKDSQHIVGVKQRLVGDTVNIKKWQMEPGGVG